MKHIGSVLALALLVISNEGLSQTGTANKASGIKYRAEEEIKQVAKQTDSITVVLFGALWCPPCIRATEYIEPLTKEKKLRSLYITPWVTTDGQAERTEMMNKKLKVSMDKVYYYANADVKELSYEGVSFIGVPLTFIYKNGKLVDNFHWDGSENRFFR